MCGFGKTEREVRRRVQTGSNAWRAVEGVIADRRMSKILKGQGREHVCHTGMHIRNGNLGTDRTTTTNAASVENNWVRKIARVPRAGRRRMVELRELAGVQSSWCAKRCKPVLHSTNISFGTNEV